MRSLAELWRERFAARIWGDLSIDLQWSLVFGLKRGTAHHRHLVVLEGLTLLDGGEPTELGAAVIRHGRRVLAQLDQRSTQKRGRA